MEVSDSTGLDWDLNLDVVSDSTHRVVKKVGELEESCPVQVVDRRCIPRLWSPSIPDPVLTWAANALMLKERAAVRSQTRSEIWIHSRRLRHTNPGWTSPCDMTTIFHLTACAWNARLNGSWQCPSRTPWM